MNFVTSFCPICGNTLSRTDGNKYYFRCALDPNEPSSFHYEYRGVTSLSSKVERIWFKENNVPYFIINSTIIGSLIKKQHRTIYESTILIPILTSAAEVENYILL